MSKDLFSCHDGHPELKPLGRPCHECAVVDGFYLPFAEELSKLSPERIDYISRRWFCHCHPDRACAGNIEFQKAKAR